MNLRATMLAFVAVGCLAAPAFAGGAPLSEEIDVKRIPEVWRELANESVMFPLEMRDIAMKIGPERQLFVDNCLIGEASNVTREVHQPVREPKPVLPAPEKSPMAFVLHVLEFDEPPRFRMWYWSFLHWHQWSEQEVIRFATGYAVSEDGVHWECPDLGLYHIEGAPDAKNIVLPYGLMHGLFYEPWEPDPQKRFKALVCVEAKNKEDGRYTIPEGYYLHTSPDGIHWKGDLSRRVIPSMPRYTYPQDGIGDTTRFWWDPYRKKYVGDVKFVLPGKLRCRGMMESDDLIHWTRARPTFFARDPDTQVYGHRGFPYQGMYIGLRWLYYPKLGPPPHPHHMPAELDCSRDGKIWTRVGAGQPFMAMNLKHDTWDATCLKPTAMLVVGKEIWIYYTGYTASHPVYRSWSTGLARLRLDGFASINAGRQTGRLLTRPLGFKGKRLHVNAEVAPGGSLRVGFLGDGEKAVEGLGVADCEPIRGDSIDSVVSWKAGADISALAGSDVRLEFLLQEAKLYSFWIE